MKKDTFYIEYIIMLITALFVLLLSMFRQNFEPQWLVDVVIIGLPATLCIIQYFRYRKSHLKHIYTDEELKKRK